MPVPWQNITTLVSLSSRVGGSPKGPRAVILQREIWISEAGLPGAYSPISNMSRHHSVRVNLGKNHFEQESHERTTLINSEKLPVVEDLDMMEYCLEIKKETRGLNCFPSNCLTIHSSILNYLVTG